MYIVITAIHNDIALNHMLIRLNWPVYKVTFVLSKGQLAVIPMQLANALVQCLYLNRAIVVIWKIMDDCIVKNHLYKVGKC